MGYKTVNELLELCKQEIENGNGDRKILLSDDDEGNGYHALYYDFTPAEELFKDDEDDGEEFDLSELPYFMRTHIEDGGTLSDFIILG
jgi:hypothetical protein